MHSSKNVVKTDFTQHYCNREKETSVQYLTQFQILPRQARTYSQGGGWGPVGGNFKRKCQGSVGFWQTDLTGFPKAGEDDQLSLGKWWRRGTNQIAR